MKAHKFESDQLVIRWQEFKTFIMSYFYPIRYVQTQWIHWNYFRKRKSQNVQEQITEFKKMAIMGISPKNPYVLLKYLGGLNNHIWRQVILFNYRFIDEAYVQAQHLENIGQKKGQLRSQNKKRDKMLPRRVRISGRERRRRL